LLPPAVYTRGTANNSKGVSRRRQGKHYRDTRQDVSLEAGKIQETVNVEAAPSLIIPPVLKPTGHDAQTLNTLPLASPISCFCSLSSGVSGDRQTRTAGRGTADVSVNGQRTSNNSVSLNGSTSTISTRTLRYGPLPNPDTLQEMKVATSLYDATQGSKGGGALGLVTKTGTKDFHWDLYWSHRNDYFNANNISSTRMGPSAAVCCRTFSAAVAVVRFPSGGFWFFNYQGVRARNGIDPNGSSTAPIVQAFNRNADGSVTAQALATQFNLNLNQIDPVAVNILNLKDNRLGEPIWCRGPVRVAAAALAPQQAWERLVPRQL